MSTVAQRRRKLFVGPKCNGMLMTPDEFDHAEFDELWRYELVNGVLIVSPIPSEQEADPNEELGYWLRRYQEDHPRGASLDKTLQERMIRTGRNRRRGDRLIWAGLGRLPRRYETPTIVAEFVSSGRKNRERDYETKRDEYMKIRVQEYWIIDRFERCMVVFSRHGNQIRKRVVKENQIYRTPLLPGFELPLAKLLSLADRWSEAEETIEEAMQ